MPAQGKDDNPAAVAANAINALGLDILSRGAVAGENTLLSPYSIQMAFAMTWVGADGATRDEMARVLHYPGDNVHASFAALADGLADIARRSAEASAKDKANGDPIVLTAANRLFGQDGYDFRQPFLDLLANTYHAPFDPADFVENAPQERIRINTWVEDQTRERINDLLPNGAISRDTRLVLVNAIYLNAPWDSPFDSTLTEARTFHTGAGKDVDVPTMERTGSYGYHAYDGFSVVVVPYRGGELQLLILLPDGVDGLAPLEQKITPQLLAEATQTSRTQVRLRMPRLHIEPPSMSLKATMIKLGMKTAFDVPERSANFDRMAPRRPDDYLAISDAFHKTFLDLDEKGTEAAAATAVVMIRVTGIARPVDPVEVNVDRPFLFAIQHRASGACLFLGRVVDPRTKP